MRVACAFGRENPGRCQQRDSARHVFPPPMSEKDCDSAEATNACRFLRLKWRRGAGARIRKNAQARDGWPMRLGRYATRSKITLCASRLTVALRPASVQALVWLERRPEAAAPPHHVP